jgi:uncharacterized phage protein gp47/JayE
MVFERQNFAQIFAAMRDRTPPALTDFQEGSVVRTMFESFAYEIALLYSQMEKVYLSAYVDTAEGVQLEQVVAILGIKRGEPDFATGKVTFIRDIGIDEDILIPINTLVTTSEDTPESPKKAYKTIEAQTLYRDTTAIDVRVQAMQRGESQKTDAETIAVMPQPITGVKSVINQEAILFTGKRQETDQELRDRAKKTLLAASGANTTAIEQALISLPGVKQVQVRENFHYARGEVTLTLDSDSQTITIPKDTQIKIGQQSFKTTNKIQISPGSFVKVNVQALVAGQAGQLTQASTEPTINNIQSVAINVTNEQPILLKDFGIIEVFVDGVDFSDTAKVSELQQEIDRVRAAGIYVLLKPAIPVTINGIFQIELSPNLKLPKPEILKLEAEIQKAIKSHIIEQKMGQPLLISQLTKKVLEINGVNDISDFTLEIWREIGEYAEGKVTLNYQSGKKPVTIPPNTRLRTDKNQSFVTLQEVTFNQQDTSIEVRVRAIVAGKTGEILNAGTAVKWQNLVIEGTNETTFTLSNSEPIEIISEKYHSSDKPIKQLLVDVLEKFTPGYIRVASEIKPLIINLDIHLQIENLTVDNSADRLETAIAQLIYHYFESHPTQIKKNEIEAEIATSPTININQVQVNLKPEFWQPGLPFNGKTVEISFVEKAEIGQLFIYNKILQISGAFQLTLPATFLQTERQEIYQNVRDKLTEYLEILQPEENLNIEKLVEIAKSVDKVLDVTWKLDDFLAKIDNQIINNRIDKQELRVNKFEKIQLADEFAINSDIQEVAIEITAMTLKINIIGAVFESINQQQLKSLMQQAIANIFDDSTLTQKLPKFSVGQNLDYAQFKVNLLVAIREKNRLISRESIIKLLPANLKEKEQLADLTLNFLTSADYTIVQLDFQPNNLILPTGNILIRTIERAQISPIFKDKVTVEIDIPPVTTIPKPDVTNLINQGKAIESRIPKN